VRWQAQRDTALDSLAGDHHPKRRRRFALPAHSKKSLQVTIPVYWGVLQARHEYLAED
jgi:hypothetical protein